MKTANKLTFLSTKFFTENKREYRITVTISLDDDCHNNMCDWSITADIRWKNEYGIYKEYMGGCCHDEIAKHCPELAKFIPLHCCNHYGAPMYPVENGMYHIKNSDKSVAIEYLRISDKEYSKLSEAVDDKMYFKYLLFNLGIVDRWKRESGELIAELEDLCGKKWVNPYKPEEERFTLTLTDEERLLIEERIKAGYYSAENIEKRREEAHKAKMLKKRTEPTGSKVFPVGYNMSDDGSMAFITSQLEFIKKDIEKYKKVRTSLSYRNVWGVFRNMMNYIEFFNMGTPKSLLKKSANTWIGTKHELSYESDKIKSEYVHELKRVFEVLLNHQALEILGTTNVIVDEICGEGTWAEYVARCQRWEDSQAKKRGFNF